VVVTAAGNDGANNGLEPTTPCTLPQPNLICVAAVTQAGGLAGFSNYGSTTVDVGAPGTNVLSAETDYDDVLAEPFNVNGIAGWSKLTSSGTQWGSSATRSEGSLSAADSPGSGVDYQANSNTQLIRTTPLDLTNRHGCRMRFDLRYEIEDAVDSNGFLFDALFAGAIAADDDQLFDGYEIAGDSGTSFDETEVSISRLDDRDDVLPAFALFTDGSEQFDGAYVDDLHVLCRAGTYSNAAPPAGNYVAYGGTSMATPHVAGVVALAQASHPDATDVEVVAAVKDGGAPLAALDGKTVSGRTADAAGTIAELDDPGPGPDPDPDPDPDLDPDLDVDPDPDPPIAPPTVSLAGAPAAVRVSRRGRFAYRFRATPGTSARAVFRTRRRITLARRVHLVVGRKRLSTPPGGRAVVRIELTRRHLRILRLKHRLGLRVTVVVRDASGRAARASRRLTLRAPRR
jgi:subtilisin family serine protease